MKEPKLKPCPFCGGKAELKDYTDHLHGINLWKVRCTECDTEQPSLSFKESVINRWNHRV